MAAIFLSIHESCNSWNCSLLIFELLAAISSAFFCQSLRCSLLMFESFTACVPVHRPVLCVGSFCRKLLLWWVDFYKHQQQTLWIIINITNKLGWILININNKLCFQTEAGHKHSSCMYENIVMSFSVYSQFDLLQIVKPDQHLASQSSFLPFLLFFSFADVQIEC